MTISKKALTEAIARKEDEGRHTYSIEDDKQILAAAKAHAETLKEDAPTLKDLVEGYRERAPMDCAYSKDKCHCGPCDMRRQAVGAILSRLDEFRDFVLDPPSATLSVQGVIARRAEKFCRELP